MDDQMIGIETNLPLFKETIPMTKLQILPEQDSPVVDTHVDGKKCTFKEDRRKSGSKKHRAGRNRKRSYKPFYKLTLAQQEKIERRIAKRSNRQRDNLTSCGITLAPENTTQFLIGQEKKFGDMSIDDDFGAFWDKERFKYMTERDLVEELMFLEDGVLWAEYLKVSREKVREKLNICAKEVRRCSLENEELSKCNAEMKSMLDKLRRH